ncbi:MAG: hypothetical protein V1862_10805 [Methanobacteriota archaeon]
MSSITYLDIETEIKKIPVEKLPAVYNILLDFSHTTSGTLEQDPVHSEGESRPVISRIKDLCGYIHPEDLKDYDELNKKRLKKTHYADTVDEVVYGIKRGDISKDE